ncbi:MAG: hypothetical protein ABUT39_17620, partial [Acidobacteriota bacterium]
MTNTTDTQTLAGRGQAAEAPRAPATGTVRDLLTRTVLSGEAARLRDGLDLPVRLLPMPREGTRS